MWIYGCHNFKRIRRKYIQKIKVKSSFKKVKSQDQIKDNDINALTKSVHDRRKVFI